MLSEAEEKAKRGMQSFGIGSLACYECIDQVGEGTYGYVYRAKDRRSGEIVALKRLILHRESAGFPLNAVREIKFLKFLSHKSIVQLKEVVTAKGCEDQEMPIRPDAKNDPSSEANNNNQKRAKKEEANSGSSANKDGTVTTATAAPATDPPDGKDILKLCGNLYFVFEYIEHDLSGLIDAKYSFNIREIKCIMRQLFEALEFLHERRIIHRDIKTSNILISNDHRIKLADFGLARQLPVNDFSFGRDGGNRSEAPLTNNVITLWYRPPELLLGVTKYTTTVDIWSAGCVMAELELGKPFMPGRSELEQLDLIFRTFGTPSDDQLPSLTSYPNYDKFFRAASITAPPAGGGVAPFVSLPMYGPTARGYRLDESSFQLYDRIFVYDPSRRSSAKNCLSNSYFQCKPLPPSDPRELEPLAIHEGQSFHEFQTKQQRKRDEELKKTTSSSNLVAGGIPPPPPPPPPLPQPPQYLSQSSSSSSQPTNPMNPVRAVPPPPPPPPPLQYPPSSYQTQQSYYPPHPSHHTSNNYSNNSHYNSDQQRISGGKRSHGEYHPNQYYR